MTTLDRRPVSALVRGSLSLCTALDLVISAPAFAGRTTGSSPPSSDHQQPVVLPEEFAEMGGGSPIVVPEESRGDFIRRVSGAARNARTVGKVDANATPAGVGATSKLPTVSRDANGRVVGSTSARH